MNRRMIDASMWQNEKFTRMPLGARMLQIGIINYADDQGRAKANPSFLRMQIFPDDDDITNADVQKWLNLMNKNGTIILYTVDEKQYAQLANWWKYQSLQYASPSQFPRPDGWKDRIRKTVTKGFIATCNWQTVDGTLLTDTCDQDGNPLPKQPQPKAPPNPPNGDKSPNGVVPHQVYEHSKIVSDSPVYSGDYSGESTPVQPPEPTTKLNRTELNRIEMSGNTHAREAETQEVQPISPPVVPKLKEAEYLPGVPDPRKQRHWQKEHVQTAEQTEQAGQLGLSAKDFRLLVDTVLEGFGQKVLADKGDDVILRNGRAVTLEIAKLDSRFRTQFGIESIFASWHETYPNFTTPPVPKQLKEHAGLMLSGKLRTKPLPQVMQTTPIKVDFTLGELLR